MKLIVDRIADGIAVLEKEDMTHMDVPVAVLPQGVREGNILDFDGRTYCLNSEAESAARERIINKQRIIFKKR